MPCKKGDYLGGIIDRKTLMDRCRIDHDTGCWHWSMAFNQGSPRVHVRLPDGSNKVMRGRAAAFYIRTGSFIPQGMCAAPMNCRSADCVNPDHAKLVTRAQHGKLLSESGAVKSRPAKVRAARETAQKLRKLSPEQIAEILASSESSYALASKFGVSQYAIWRVRDGQSYRDNLPMRNASVFNWGGAA